MPTQVWRPGDYRVCPRCLARHKVQDLRCTHCNTVLAGAAVRHAAAPVVAGGAARTGRGLRAVLAVGLVLALAAGLWVRSLFRGRRPRGRRRAGRERDAGAGPRRGAELHAAGAQLSADGRLQRRRALEHGQPSPSQASPLARTPAPIPARRPLPPAESAAPRRG